MNLKKLAPWNWFKDEEQVETKSVPVKREEEGWHLTKLYHDMDRLFDNAFRTFGMPSLFHREHVSGLGEGVMLKPKVDIASSDKKYEIAVEVPGVKTEDIDLELNGRKLIIRGEKIHEEKKEEKDFHRVERSYGSFQRILTLPEDVKLDSVKANSKDGVLKIEIERDIDRPQSSNVRKIAINS